MSVTTKSKKRTESKSDYRLTLEKKAERVIKDTGRYPRNIRDAVKTVLRTEPHALGRVLRNVERLEQTIEARTKPIADGAQEFAFKAYSGALDFYYDNHHDPNALKCYLAPTTKKRRGAKPAPESSTAALAEHLSAIIGHPLLPTPIYNAMIDQMADTLDDALDKSTPEYFERCLEAYAEKQQEARANQ